MLESLTLIAQNVGMDFTSLVLFIFLWGSIVFYAKDWKLGIMMCIMISGTLFVIFHELGLDFKNALYIFFGFMVMLIFSLYYVNKSAQQAGGFI